MWFVLVGMFYGGAESFGDVFGGDFDLWVVCEIAYEFSWRSVCDGGLVFRVFGLPPM